MNKLLIVLLSVAFLPSNAAVADSQQPNARYCLVCHGSAAQGNAAIQAPNLSILPDWYLQQQFVAFRNNWRGGAQDDTHGKEMQAVAGIMSDTEIHQAIAFIRSIKPVAKPTPGSIEHDVQHGRLLYQTCRACHGSNGEGNAQLKAPPLAGQQPGYLAQQLIAFRNGWRGNQADDTYGRTMRPFAQSLPDKQAIDDVVAYIDTLASSSK
ncbi:c-type cytochrome [Rheinheimera sp. YQF-2]|uniref:C-type cytochrome n=1 Tax=Rheinheimera lutimaris TaxID=2740584 RepID=A0A7Y5APP9_9GAMM|nr:c-type cytochrome [Rheinheimera lutimaris]NRQ42250.1 c-type cytochrome [Rheinheimera lutimaris]